MTSKRGWGIPLEAFGFVMLSAILMMLADLFSGTVSASFLGAGVAVLLTSVFLVITQTGTLD